MNRKTLNEEALVDLHMHTCASDGTQTPEALIEELKSKNIQLFSVTDHDTVASIETVKNLAEREAICFLPGVEISTSWGDVELHILTYGVRTDDEKLLDILNENQNIRDSHNRALILYLQSKFSKVSVDAYDAYTPEESLGGWKSLNYLLEIGVVKHMHDVFDLIKEMGTPMVFPSYQTMIPKLKALGYTLVLAHPPAYLKGECLDVTFLDELVALGMDGIECYSPYYREDDADSRAFYLEYCQANHLYVTSGSDAHGTFTKNRAIGKPKTPLKALKLDFLKQYFTALDEQF